MIEVYKQVDIMTDTPLDRIIRKTGKAMRVPEEIKLPKKKKKRAKSPKYDTGEKAWARQIDEILTGKKISDVSYDQRQSG
jgi:hypothetical protein